MIILFIVSNAPTIHTATYPKFPINPIIGFINPDKNWLFLFASYTFLLYSSNFLSASFLPLYTFTTFSPEFENIVFQYDNNDKPTIQGFSAIAQPGQKIAIVGPTGAGKTTLVNLLMKFYDIDSGSIKKNGAFCIIPLAIVNNCL